jgi:hypothetical protein
MYKNNSHGVKNMLHLFRIAQYLPFFWTKVRKSLFTGMYLLPLERDVRALARSSPFSGSIPNLVELPLKNILYPGVTGFWLCNTIFAYLII